MWVPGEDFSGSWDFQSFFTSSRLWRLSISDKVLEDGDVSVVCKSGVSVSLVHAPVVKYEMLLDPANFREENREEVEGLIYSDR